MRTKWIPLLVLTSGLSFLPSYGWSAEDNSADSDLLNLSLKQLSDVEVTSVSKRTEKASQAAAAIYVISQEDIRRSGLQSVPELLRMVPGLQVARSGSQNWAITARGFNGQFANKLLVLIDGRTVYTPVFAGVFWDVQNMLLEDVERIEVIRGPGATLWGANAVNGVINIITKNSKDTQGKLVTTSIGSDVRTQTGARYGGKSGDMSYRTYAQYQNTDEQKLASGGGAKDDWSHQQAGFRFDWNQSEKEHKTLQGDVYRGTAHDMRNIPVTDAISPTFEQAVLSKDSTSGANILGRWKQGLSNGSDISVQAYYDLVNRKLGDVGASLRTQTFDFDFQHNIAFNSRNDVTWGVGYRFINSGFGNSLYINYTPENSYQQLFSGFMQDKVTLIPEKLFFTFGTKLEHNDFSTFEYEPSARLAWTPDSKQTVWAAVSRAVHAKTQTDDNLSLILAGLPTPAPFDAFATSTLLAEQGNSGTATSEDVVTYELGYRVQPVQNFSLDVTGFVNQYSNLASLEEGTPELRNDPVLGDYIYQPLISKNDNRGETHGLEAAATWEVTPSVKLSGGYSLFYNSLHIVGPSLVTKRGTAPTQQFNARSYIDLPHDLQFDTMAYFVDPLKSLGVKSYTRLDTRLGWVPVQGIDISLIGQNLLETSHKEYSGFLYQNSEEIGRSVVARATARF